MKSIGWINTKEYSFDCASCMKRYQTGLTPGSLNGEACRNRQVR